MAASPTLCVMIPVHQPVITADEELSLLACKAHLSGYDCFLIYPAGMDTAAYTNIHPGLLLKPVDENWLSSIEKYNKMKLSISFYQLFVKYDYLLTYELDAYIFNADFDGNNAFKFDYIGAPFFEGYWAAKPGAPFIKGCNSGFSVRNIKSCISALQSLSKYRFAWLLYKYTLAKSSRLRRLLNQWTNGKYEVFITGRFAFSFAGFHLNEDLVWSEIAPQLVPSFTVADGMSALQFSFEYNLPDSLKLNGGRLPLGCHAWAKHPEFWDDYIDFTTIGKKGRINEV